MSAFPFYHTSSKKLTPFSKCIVIIFAVIFALAVYFVASGEDGIQDILPAANPISYIAEDCDIYTVIVILTGKETKNNINIFMEICGGFDIEAVFFMTTEYMDKNASLVEKIYSEGHTVGLVCRETSKLTRSGFMKYLARCNDEFYSLTGRYPKYCYIEGSPSPYAPEVINAYGQYYVSYGVEITREKDKQIKNGFIVAVNLTESDGSYAFARAVSGALEAKLKAVNMKEFIKTYEQLQES